MHPIFLCAHKVPGPWDAVPGHTAGQCVQETRKNLQLAIVPTGPCQFRIKDSEAILNCNWQKTNKQSKHFGTSLSPLLQVGGHLLPRQLNSLLVKHEGDLFPSMNHNKSKRECYQPGSLSLTLCCMNPKLATCSHLFPTTVSG